MGRNKYNAQKVKYNGLVFDSKLEFERYIFLVDQIRLGNITQLVVHPKFRIRLAGEHGYVEWSYTADFEYRRVEHTDAGCAPVGAGPCYRGESERIVEDVKSPPTAKKLIYRRNVKAVKACYGVDVRTVFSATQELA